MVPGKSGSPPQRGGRRGPGRQVQEDVGVWEEDGQWNRRERDGGLLPSPGWPGLTGSPFVMVVTAEKAGPKVVSILLWRENR